MHATTANLGHSHRTRHEFHPLERLVQAFAVRKQRMRLDQLDDHLLRDIGIDRRTAYWEAHKPFWDRP